MKNSFSYFCLGIIALQYFGCVFNTHLMLVPPLSNYFTFTLCSILLCILAVYKYSACIPTGKLSFLVLLWCIYISVHTLFMINKADYYIPVYLTYSLGMYMAFCLLFTHDTSLRLKTSSIILTIAFFQSVYCLFQFVGITESLSPYFQITGSFSNPNVSAMQIAASLPLFTRIKKHKLLYTGSLLLCFFALLILNCRTAWIGATFYILFNLYTHYEFYLKNVYKRLTLCKKLSVVLLFIGLSIIVSGFLFQYKQTSSDSRFAIWNQCIEMVGQHPLKGYGYGMFEKEYNLFRPTASQVFMAYNDYLEQAVEGGIIGFLFFLIFICWLLTSSIRCKDKIAVCGLWLIAIMGLFNFIVNAFPVWYLFLFYAASVFIDTNKIYFITIGKKSKAIILTLFTIFLFNHGRIAYYQTEAKTHIDKINKNVIDKEHILTLLNDDYTVLDNSPYFLDAYSHILYYYEEYAKAIPIHIQALNYTSTPSIYIRLGKCYRMEKEYTKAEGAFLTAFHILPSNFESRYLLMSLYGEIGQTKKQADMAHEIIELRPKIPSKKVEEYKLKAYEIIKEMQQH